MPPRDLIGQPPQRLGAAVPALGVDARITQGGLSDPQSAGKASAEEIDSVETDVPTRCCVRPVQAGASLSQLRNELVLRECLGLGRLGERADARGCVCVKSVVEAADFGAHQDFFV